MTSRVGIERSLGMLQESGYRLTATRRVVIEAAQQAAGAFTADELVRELASQPTGVGRATVFRTLDALVQSGVLERLHRPDGCHSYVLCSMTDEHHHHLVCSDCRAVIQFEDCTVAPLLEELGRRTDFEITGHWLEVFGLCSNCRR